jgi:pre-mRNA-processing factor SLU7
VIHNLQAQFAGDNFNRYTGEAPAMQNLQLFAWQANARGSDVHLNANPTQGELLHHEYREKKEKHRESTKVGILSKYGGEEYLAAPPVELRQGQTEEYVEYSRSGQVIKGKERTKTRSKYPEDSKSFQILVCSGSYAYQNPVFINNHTAVWGSWYNVENRTWGYACCRSTIHLSYCVGEINMLAAKESSAKALLSTAASFAPPPVPSTSEKQPEKKDEGATASNFSVKRIGEGHIELDKERLALAIQEEKKRKMRLDDDDERLGKKKKDYVGREVTEEDMGKLSFCSVFLAVSNILPAEAYRMHRRMAEDPMANYVDTEV